MKFYHVLLTTRRSVDWKDFVLIKTPHGSIGMSPQSVS